MVRLENKIRAKAYKIVLDWLVQRTSRTYFAEFIELYRVVRAAMVAELGGKAADVAFINRIGYAGVAPWAGVEDGIRRLEAMAKAMTAATGGYDVVLVDVSNKAVVPLLAAPPDTSGMVPVSIKQALLGRILNRRNLN